MKETRKYKFKKGQKLHLDEIYDVQGISDNWHGFGRWWEHDDYDPEKDMGPGDNVTVTKDIKFLITVEV